MSLNPKVTQRYSLGPVKSWVENAAYLIGPKFGIKTIYGWRAQDPFPDHPSGHALDFMITSKGQGQAVADFVQQNSSALGVKYIIWNHQVWEASGKPVVGWHPYDGSNPHTDHVHVTFLDQPGSGAVSATDVPASGTGSSGPSTDPNCAWGAHVPVSGDICVLSKVQVRGLVATVVLMTSIGIGLVGIALVVVKGFERGGMAVPIARLVSRAG